MAQSISNRNVLIVGASGVVGTAAMQHFADRPDWTVWTLSRRTPERPTTGRVNHLCVNLMDAHACEIALQAMPAISHVVYAALYEQPGLVAGWRDPQQMTTNLDMLRNILDPLTRTQRGLQHVSLLQGTKAYGVHLHPVPLPARESLPRDPHENFYWLQEDFLRALANNCGFHYTIFRPQVIFGEALGVAMNLIPVIGVYAAVCREQGLPFSYPGGPSPVRSATDSRLLAAALAWAADAQSARNQTFNITNGDVFGWQQIWPALAPMLGVLPGPDTPRSMATFLPQHASVWDHIVSRHRLAAPPLARMLGESHHYADFAFSLNAPELPAPVVLSTIKLRQAGFADCIDTEAMFGEWFRILQSKRLLPQP